jgi:hypothetical protein
MKYFLDTEFLEGTQKTFFGNSKPTIDLISIGIVADDGREYYAISKDFNLKEAWNRWQQRTGEGDRNNIQPRLYWIRENVLRQLFNDLRLMQNKDIDKMNQLRVNHSENWLTGDEFSFKVLKKLLNKYGKSNKQIAEGIVEFTYNHIFYKFRGSEREFHQRTKNYGWNLKEPIEFYAYYADYDWVAFCWLFGKMMDLPKEYPMYCRDLKQIFDSKISPQEIRAIGYDGAVKRLKANGTYPKQENEHSALADAKWNRQLFRFLEGVGK